MGCNIFARIFYFKHIIQNMMQLINYFTNKISNKILYPSNWFPEAIRQHTGQSNQLKQ